MLYLSLKMDDWYHKTHEYWQGIVIWVKPLTQKYYDYYDRIGLGIAGQAHIA